MPRQHDRALTVAEMRAVKDTDIDFSDIPEADEAFWNEAAIQMPSGRTKTQLNVRFDADFVDWFKAQGKGYQTRMNAVLRSFYEAHRTSGPSSKS